MYDFLLSEVWWMNTIIESLITGATAVLVAYVAYLGKVNKIMDNQEQLKSLNKEHGGLSADKQILFDKITSGSETFKIIEKELLEINNKYIELKVNFNNLDKENRLLRKDKLSMNNEVNNLKQENLNLKKEYNKIYSFFKDSEKKKKNEQQQEFEKEFNKIFFI